MSLACITLIYDRRIFMVHMLRFFDIQSEQMPVEDIGRWKLTRKHIQGLR